MPKLKLPSVFTFNFFFPLNVTEYRLWCLCSHFHQKVKKKSHHPHSVSAGGHRLTSLWERRVNEPNAPLLCNRPGLRSRDINTRSSLLLAQILTLSLVFNFTSSEPCYWVGHGRSVTTRSSKMHGGVLPRLMVAV